MKEDVELGGKGSIANESERMDMEKIECVKVGGSQMISIPEFCKNWYVKLQVQLQGFLINLSSHW